MSACQYDTGSMYDCRPACSRTAAVTFTYRPACYPAVSLRLCAGHVAPMAGRVYPDSHSVSEPSR